MYVGPYEISMTECFCQSRDQLKAVNYFRKNAPSQMFNTVLNMPRKKEKNTYCCIEGCNLFLLLIEKFMCYINIYLTYIHIQDYLKTCNLFLKE